MPTNPLDDDGRLRLPDRLKALIETKPNLVSAVLWHIHPQAQKDEADDLLLAGKSPEWIMSQKSAHALLAEDLRSAQIEMLRWRLHRLMN